MSVMEERSFLKLPLSLLAPKKESKGDLGRKGVIGALSVRNSDVASMTTAVESGRQVAILKALSTGIK